MSSSNQSVPQRKNKGRQKVNMVKMENQSNLQVTFSKRRAGLFKKASELCTLCGAEAAIVVFSPADKVYCFGHPNVSTVIDRFEAGVATIQPTNSINELITEAHRSSTVRELNLELTQVESLLRAERRRCEETEMMRKTGEIQQWLPTTTSFDELNYAQLCALKESIMGFKKNVDVKLQKDMVMTLPDPKGYQDISCPPPRFNKALELSLGSSGFGPNYSSHGINNSGLFGANMSGGQGSNDVINSDYLRSGGNNMSSSYKLPTDPYAVGSGGFGFNLGQDHPRLF